MSAKSPARRARRESTIPDILPVLPLKDVVLFPYVIVPLSVSREKSIAAVDAALAEQRILLLVAQKDASVEEPDPNDLYTIGTAAAVMRMLKLPDGRIRLLVQGLSRVRIDSFVAETPSLRAKVDAHPRARGAQRPRPRRSRRSSGASRRRSRRPSPSASQISPEVMVVAAGLEEPARLADLAASNLELKIDEAQKILETVPAVERLKIVLEILRREIRVLTVQQEITGAAQGEIDKSQREYFLRQQLKAIQQELGETDDLAEEIAAYRKAVIAEKKIPEEAAQEIEKQVKRLERGNPDSAENAMIRTYLDWITGLPWATSSRTDNLDLVRARKILDEDHYDLEKVKQRILEFLAVRKLAPDSKGPILCFVGPPGVGKTSLGRSIARALDRKFLRLSLGGVRDEAEIRGHRRTYVGAMPGPDHPGPLAGRDLEPRLHPRRGRQDRRRLPRRPVLRPPRGPRPRAEQDVPRPLPRRELRPLEGPLHHDRERPRHDPAGLPRPDGGHPPLGLHARGEARDREGGTDPEAAQGERPARRTRIDVHATTRSARSSRTTRARRASAASSARSASCCRKVAVRWASGKKTQVDVTPRRGQGVPRHPEVPRRRGAPHRPGRRGDGPRLDGRRRRRPHRRGASRARQGPPPADGPARRRHEGVRAGRAHVRALPRRAARPRRGLLRDARRPRPRPRGRDPEGRPVGRRHDGDAR